MERFDLENFPLSESAKNMIGYVSDGFYDNSYVGKWLYEVMGREYDTAREMAEDIINQLFPETATWGLMYHEIKWGLPIRENLSYEERRQQIYRKRDYRAPMTPFKMEIYLKLVTGFDVIIADIHDPGPYGYIPPHPNVFKVFFMGEGTLDIKKAYEMLDSIKQTHTSYCMSDVSNSLIRHKNHITLSNITLKMCCANMNGHADCAVLVRCCTKNTQKVDASLIVRYDLWRLDGKILLDGSRLLDAVDEKEVL